MANQQAKYEDALAMMVTDFEGAYPVFQELGNYDQSSTYASFCLLCIELKEFECSDTPVEFSIIQSKISQFDEYNMEVEYDFDELRNIVIFAEGLYGTYWEGGGHVDSKYPIPVPFLHVVSEQMDFLWMQHGTLQLNTRFMC